MKLLFAHVARKSLVRFQLPSLLFEPWNGASCFERAVTAYRRTMRLDKVILVCPAEDSAFVENSLSRVFSEGSEGTPVCVFPVPETAPYAMGVDQSRFHPVRMETDDAFGLWSLEGLEQIARKSLGAGNLLVLNLESFWYLTATAIDQLMEATVREDFMIRGAHPEDICLGFEYDRRIPEFSGARMRSRREIEQLKSNYHTLTRGSLPRIAEAVERRRNARLDRLAAEPLLIKKILFPQGASSGFSQTLRSRLCPDGPGLSLRYPFGRNRVNFLSSLDWESTAESLCNRMQALPASSPQVVQVNVENANTSLSTAAFERFLDAWQDIPYWVFRDHPLSLSSPELSGWLHAIQKRNAGRTYVEWGGGTITEEILENLFLAGLSVWVIRVDDFLQTVPAANRQHTLEQMIEMCLRVRDRDRDRFILLKIHNRSGDMDFIPLLMQRWFGIVDALVVTPSLNPAEHLRHTPFNIPCAVVPFEINLRSDGKLALCTEVGEAKLDVSHSRSWEDAWADAGQMPECAHCCKRYRYGPKPVFQLPRSLLREAFYRDECTAGHIRHAHQSIRAGQWQKALDHLEAVLKTDPVHAQAWRGIESVEQAVKREF